MESSQYSYQAPGTSYEASGPGPGQPPADGSDISALADKEWADVNTILDESTVRDIIPRLKKAGAQGIVEYPLNKIVL